MHMKCFNVKTLSTLAAVLMLMLCIGEAQAQFEFKWMNVGSMWSPYSEGGANREQEPFDNAPVFYPAIDHRGGNVRAQAIWIGVRDFTDETGKAFPYKVAHIGPRSGGEVQFFPTKAEVIAKFDPTVEVDGAKSFRQFVFVDKFDPNLKADRQIQISTNSRVGIQTDITVSAFSQEFHDNYHIIEYKFTNTGNIDTDAEIELSAPLKEVYFFFIARYATHEAASWVTGNGAPWGKFAMNDVVGDGHHDFGVDFRAQYSWAGYSVFQSDFDALGGPMWREAPDWSASNPDTTGRLASAHFTGRVTLHADKSTTDKTDDRAQPSTTGVKGSDDADLVDDEFNLDLMRRQYQNFMQLGHQFPHHAETIEPSGQFDKPKNDPAQAYGRYDEGGWAIVEGYGPYNINVGQSIDIKIADAAAGLSDAAKLAIGSAYKQSKANNDLLIPFTYNGQEIRLTKNQWVLTGRDSLFKTFNRAIANYKSGFGIAPPPLPPERFSVTSGTDKITLEWQTYSGSSQTGWEVFRKSKQYQDPMGYEKIATLPADARRYEDKGVVRGIDYFYYIQAIGSANTNATGLTPTGVALKSGRYYTQTYLPANLRRPSGTSLSQVRIVPNPFNLGADETVRFPGQSNQNSANRLAFFEIPGQCTIKIYTQLGELVTTIEHTNGSGDEFWDQSTASRQVVSSGVYLAVVENTATGEKVIKKFVIIR